MALSLNARFLGAADPDAEFEHPPGASIARFLRGTLAKRGWEVADFDNWRDCGWSITCCGRASKLELAFASVGGEQWFLQIAPSYVPGPFGRIFRKAASAAPDAVQALALDAFAALSESGRFRRFMWCWDGDPDETNSTPRPVSISAR